MPTYEYECKKCKHRFSVMQKITEDPLKRCPECKGRVQRLLSGGAGIIFKGSGFYATDYRSENYKKRAKEEAPASSSSSTETVSKPKKAESSTPSE